jgi:hypothetical protein
MDVSILTHLVNMRLPCLASLTLISLSPSNISLPAISAARDLLALPSLHTLVIDASFPSRAAFHTLFARCTSTLHTLDLRYVYSSGVADPPNTADLGLPPPAGSDARRAEITHVGLSCVDTHRRVADAFPVARMEVKKKP